AAYHGGALRALAPGRDRGRKGSGAPRPARSRALLRSRRASPAERGAALRVGARVKIRRLKAQGFGTFTGEITFDPERLNLIVGANEAGKNTIPAGNSAAL